MEILEGKSVAEKIKSGFEERISKLNKKPYLAVLGIHGDDASAVYVKRIQKRIQRQEKDALPVKGVFFIY